MYILGTRDMLPASDIDVQNEARVVSTEVFEETAASRLANKSVEALSTRYHTLQESPNWPAKTIPEPSFIPTSITITFSDFRKVFLRCLPQWSMTNEASQLVHNSPLFRLHLKRYKKLVAHSDDSHLREHFHDLLSSISSALRVNYDACNKTLPNATFRRAGETRAGEGAPTSVAFEYETECDQGNDDWRHAILFFQCGDQSRAGPVAAEFQEQQAVAALRSHSLERRESAQSTAGQHSTGLSLQEPRGSSAQACVSRAMIGEHLLGLHRCAGEMLSFSPMRRFALGAVVLGMSVYFGYFDHAGAVFGSPIHLEDDAEVFINAVLNACCAGRRRHFTEPPYPDFVCNPVTFSSDLIDHLNYNLTINGSISSPSEEDSRPSHLFSARCISNSFVASPLPADVMLEMRWLPCSDLGGTDIQGISHLAESNNIAHMARIHASATACRLSECERAELGLVPSLDLEFRITLFSPPCVPLHTVSDGKRFKQAFITLVKGKLNKLMLRIRMLIENQLVHYEAYSQIGMLHRDISPRNLMVSRDEPDQGVLSGFYSATTAMTVDGSPRAGALAFLAVELLENDAEPAVFRYRHDLESFLYVLAWIALRPQDEPTAHPLCGWWRRNGETSRNLKLQFLKGVFSHEDVAASVVPLRWITGITELFRQGYEALEGSGSRRQGMTGFDEETLGGHITYEKFLEVILT
jgi:hypothetical protein